MKRARVEPEWWSKARKLHAQGLTITAISKLLGYVHGSVKYALCEKRRQQINESSSTYSRYKRKPSRLRNERPYVWRKARRQAIAEWREKGGNLTDYYIKYGVNDAKNS